MHRRFAIALTVLALVATAGCLGAPFASDIPEPSTTVHVTLRNDAPGPLTYHVSIATTPPTHAILTAPNGTTTRTTDFPPGLTRYAPTHATAVTFHPAGVVNRTLTLTADSTVGTRINALPDDPVVRIVVTNGDRVVFYGTAYCSDGATETVFLGVDENGTATTGMQCGPA